MEETMRLFDKEFTNSMKKHGTWDDYPTKKMFDKIEDELQEVIKAYFLNDHTSEHRLSIELLQVAVCCVKMSYQIKRRHESPKKEPRNA
jgi:hypothetical protein